MKKTARQIGRRRFLKAVPATVAAGMALPAATLSSTPALQRSAATPPRVAKDALKGAEQIAGLHLTEAEEDAALNGVSRNLDAYEQLRKLTVPLDTEPAITFRPYLPGKQPAGRTSIIGRNAKLALSKPVAPGSSRAAKITSNLEELAFEPVTVLAPLIESRKISSTDLTKMYLAR